MPTSNEQIAAHLDTLMYAAQKAANTVASYEVHASKMTASARATERATITTVPSDLQHASNCSLCNGWDGS
jgi:adenine-specific DNA methylase